MVKTRRNEIIVIRSRNIVKKNYVDFINMYNCNNCWAANYNTDICNIVYSIGLRCSDIITALL